MSIPDPGPGPLEDVPGFAAPPAGEELPIEEDESPSTPSRSTSGERPTPPSPPPSTSSTSSQASTEIDLDQTIATLAAGVAHLFGVLVNKLARQRTRTQTNLWLLTEAEAKGIGEPLGRMSARRVPDSLTSGDGGDVLDLGANLLGYAMHNAMGIDGETLERHQGVVDVEATEVRPAPAPPPPAPAPAAPGSRSGSPTAEATAPAEPPPPSVLLGL